MALQILSDLHLEAPKAYDIFSITPRAPYLALLGDIGTVAAHNADFLAFLTAQLRQFRAVLFVPGNHEAYHSSWPETLAILREFEEECRGKEGLGEFVLMDRGVYRLPPEGGKRMVVLGCSLFSRVAKEDAMAVEMGLNDFYKTRGWDVKQHNAAHERDLGWLNERVGELEQEEDGGEVRVVVLTHWMPTRDERATEPRHAGSRITSGFSTDLSGERCFASGRVKVWAFGHTHYNCDFVVERGEAGPLRLVANQRGYYFSQTEGFDGEKTIEV
ncbi:hypothetical protein C8A05DRAFT_37057 [Staphylotrichum tortipilum]|uniref:Calcineurin-like phosphoesterase domain-containing protein n=1 Tax=Staphylotrichum tortipilum TaxID=2831512 RepID=A0AAN6MEG6_9PEZI|nr:hypothetical protein C8A05DRAFT_37057 [Staphylotrichum longicolle]